MAEPRPKDGQELGSLAHDYQNWSSARAMMLALPGLSAGSHAITLGMHTTNASSGLFGARFDDVTVTLDRVVPLPGAAVGGLTAIGALAGVAAWRRKAA